MAIPILSLITGVGSVIDTVTGFLKGKDDAISQEMLAKLDFAKAQLESASKESEMQAQANIEQAKHSSIFVAGARPFLLWVCGFGFCYEFIVRPFLVWISEYNGIPIPPSLGSVLTELTIAMLGLSVGRGVEKVLGKARNSL